MSLTVCRTGARSPAPPPQPTLRPTEDPLRAERTWKRAKRGSNGGLSSKDVAKQTKALLSRGICITRYFREQNYDEGTAKNAGPKPPPDSLSRRSDLDLKTFERPLRWGPSSTQRVLLGSAWHSSVSRTVIKLRRSHGRAAFFCRNCPVKTPDFGPSFPQPIRIRWTPNRYRSIGDEHEDRSYDTLRLHPRSTSAAGGFVTDVLRRKLVTSPGRADHLVDATRGRHRPRRRPCRRSRRGRRGRVRSCWASWRRRSGRSLRPRCGRAWRRARRRGRRRRSP